MLTSLIVSVLASSVVAALVSAIVNIYNSRQGYKHEYYKQVIARRLNVYDGLDIALSKLRMTGLTSEGHAYHLIFPSDRGMELYLELAGVLKGSIWLSKPVSHELINLMDLIDNAVRDIEKITDLNTKIDSSARHFIDIYFSFDRLSNYLRSDLLSLHNVKQMVADYKPVKIKLYNESGNIVGNPR